MSEPRELSDAAFELMMSRFPFDATYLGVPGHDADVPDDGPEAGAALLAQVEPLAGRLDDLDRSALDAADSITVGCAAEALSMLRTVAASTDAEYTVTAMPFSGPAELFGVAAMTTVPSPQAADDYLTRLRRSGAWIDQLSDRLRDGMRAGRLPVASLVQQAVAWADEQLAAGVADVLAAPAPPEGWDGASAWREQVAAVASASVEPALARWRTLLSDELLPAARPDDAPGLVAVPGGEEEYRRLIRVHTTLPLDPAELHQSGLDEIDRLERHALELGARLGLDDLAAIAAAMRAAAAAVDPETAIAGAIAAVRRAEQRSPDLFRPPLPPPCDVQPMPPGVASSGMAPHYTPPREDGSRPGIYWFNTARPTAGTGWDLEAVAFHEAVPGHHLQLSRGQLLGRLPRLQRNATVTVHAEGWGLYAEQLAEEVGLYSGVEAQLGAVAAALMRAARLVVDTGLHAFGWSRGRAVRFFTDHVPVPAGFIANEIDRYIVVPAQALAYQTGKYEILRLRDRARAALGDRFDLPGFHAAVLDHGALPMPVLADAVELWVAETGATG